MFQIEKNVSIPARRNKYPWQHMDVGDSFVVPMEKKASVKVAAVNWGKRHAACFSSREDKERGELRVWRIA